MERERLKSLALRKVKREELNQPCVECGHKVLIDFRRPVTTKTCKNVVCKTVELVEGV